MCFDMDAAQAAFAAWWTPLRRALRLGQAARAGVAQQRQALLRLEQLCKIETQLVFPALAPALRHAQQEVEPLRHAQRGVQPLRHAQQEVELLRDLALLVERSAPAERDIAWAVIEGLAELHFARVDALLRQPGAPRADWRALLDEATAWCAQWGDEMRAGGDIEDEDRDPVGLPPR